MSFDGGKSIAEMMSTLVPALLVAFSLGFVVCRVTLRLKNGGGLKDNRKLRIEETRSLGGRQYLLVVEYEGTRFLLASCVGRIEYLCPLDCVPSGPNVQCESANPGAVDEI